ncbi:MAG: Kazal-type serine protease inhibitor family protein [Afipia sp.]
MRMRLTRLIVATLIAMLGVAIRSGESGAANLNEACGGAANITCNSALWCQRAAGQCKVADAAGTCDKAPAFCMQIYRPVCGCNGKTYSNDCERQKAKVQLDHVGACPKEPKAKEPKAGKK